MGWGRRDQPPRPEGATTDFRRTSLAGRLGCRTQGAALGRRGQGQAERGSDGERGRRMLARRRETAVKGEPLFTAQQRLESARVKCYRNQTPGFRPGFAGLLPDAYASVCCFTKTLGMSPWLSDAGELERGETLPSGILSYCLCKQLRLTQIAETVGMEVLE